jgi:hypothetical protein
MNYADKTAASNLHSRISLKSTCKLENNVGMNLRVVGFEDGN